MPAGELALPGGLSRREVVALHTGRAPARGPARVSAPAAARPAPFERMRLPARAARATAPRYVIQTVEAPESWRLGLLRRAVGRLDLGDAVRGIEVDGSDGLLQLTIEVGGRSRRAARRAERAFAEVWYDAFGERDAEHLGRFA